MKLLDAFCGAGGATRGYQRAGFHVTGVDINPQPRYVGDAFHQGDALEFIAAHGHEYDAIHASPVCYLWSKMRDCRPGSKDGQPDLIGPTRELLRDRGRVWVIENVPGAPMPGAVQVCGTGLDTGVQRHRWFESSVALWGVACQHARNPWNPAYKHATGRQRRRVPVIGEWRIPKKLQDEAMGIDWMTLVELQEAIPPAYTEFIGAQLLASLCLEESR